jgi:YVTN family beta-propeller protein
MRFGRLQCLILAVALVGALGLAPAHAGPLAVVTNFTDPGLAPGSVAVIDTATDQLVGSPLQVGINPSGVAITPDGKTAVVACAQSQDLWFIDLSANPPKIAGSLKVGDGTSGPFYPFCVAMSPDGQYVAVTAIAGTLGAPGNQYVRTVRLQDRTITQTLQLPQDQFAISAEAAAISPKGSIVLIGTTTSLVYALAFAGGQISLPEGTDDQLGTYQGSQGTNVTISPDGSLALVPLGRRALQAFRIDDTGKLSPTVQLPSGGDGAQSVAITVDGKRAYVRNLISPGANIAVFDIGSGATLKDTGIRLNSDGIPAAIAALVEGGLWVGNPMVAVTPDGKKVYATNPFGQVQVFNADNPTAIKRIPTGPNPFGIAIQPK